MKTPTEETAMKWTRIEDSGGYGYQCGDWQIFDNGAGFGSAEGSRRWAVMFQGKWQVNLDTFAQAKAYAKEQS